MNFKRNSKNTKLFLFLGICLILIGICIYSQIPSTTLSVVEGPIPQISPPPISHISPITLNSLTPPTFAKVIYVVDGDTIKLENGETVRYIGIDTPEIETNECFATEASEINKNLVLGEIVKLEKDVSDTDKYGRFLRYVFLDGQMMNDYLVKSGAARVMSVPPDVKFKEEFLSSQNYAKENNLGLWSSCPISP